jgi:hypothetical protein
LRIARSGHGRRCEEGYLRLNARESAPKGDGLIDPIWRAVHMIKLTETREITPYLWMHPDDER